MAICMYCKTEFIPIHGSVGKYCSHACCKAYFKEYGRPDPRKRHIVCDYCGKVFTPKQWNAKAKHHYCSQTCASNAMRGCEAEYIPCPICGTVFLRNNDHKIYCSRTCANASRRKYTTKTEKKKAERQRHKQRYKERHREELEAAAKARAVERDKKKAEREALRLAEVEKKRLAKAHECIMCGAITSRPKYCSNQCSDKAMYRRKDLARRKNLKANGPIDNSITLYALSKRDHNICHICRKPCNLDDYKIVDGTFIAGEEYPSIDHVLPVSRGGAHVWSNVRLAHRGCNSYKSAKLYLEQPNGQMMMCI